tara:strand:- start:179 stop:364 length:186 start_codon:yes stop_codon:yes gene_type:complete
MFISAVVVALGLPPLAVLVAGEIVRQSTNAVWIALPIRVGALVTLTLTKVRPTPVLAVPVL